MRPVELHEYDPGWPDRFTAIAADVAAALAGAEAVVEHVGSTSVPGLCAKPVIDVLVGVASLADVEARIPALAARGFRYRPEHEDVLPDRRYFVRDAGEGPRAHVHAVVRGGALWADHLAFRDALRADAALAARYASHKRELAHAHAHDRAAYTAAKAPFIEGALQDLAHPDRGGAAERAAHVDATVLAWLLDSDPAIRWQVLRDLAEAPATAVADERARVAREGWGALLLAQQDPEGRWGGAAWNRGWDSTMHALLLLRDLGADPADATVRKAVRAVRERVTWRGCAPPECDDHAFFDGEVEPCINAQVAATGACFGADVRPLVDRLLSEQLADGGWNCEAERGSTRSSFNTTICVLEALLEFERSVAPDPAVRAARRRGEAYLLDRHLHRRRSTGEPIRQDRKGGADWTRFGFPHGWRYDVLRALDHLRNAEAEPDARVLEGLALVEARRGADGRWPLDTLPPGRWPFEWPEREGEASRWITLRALRVLAWGARADRPGSGA